MSLRRRKVPSSRMTGSMPACRQRARTPAGLRHPIPWTTGSIPRMKSPTPLRGGRFGIHGHEARFHGRRTGFFRDDCSDSTDEDSDPFGARDPTPRTRGPTPVRRSTISLPRMSASSPPEARSNVSLLADGSAPRMTASSSASFDVRGRTSSVPSGDGFRQRRARRRNVVRVSPGDEPGRVLREKKALESREPQERQRHAKRPRGAVRINPPRV
jgi:hypothetical protein